MVSTVLPRQGQMKLGSGISGAADTMSAAFQACEQCLASLSGIDANPDLAIVFFSPHHLTSVGQLSMAIQRRLGARHMIGVSCEGVMGGVQSLERAPGLSILAASLPGVEIKTFTTERFPASDGSAESLFALRDIIGSAEDSRFTLLLGDPFSMPLIRLLPDLNNARIGGNGVVFGGLASASLTAGGNALLLDDQIYKYGGVGVSLRGNLRVDTIVSQGCKAFGQPMVITKSRNNLIIELGGKPAIEAIQAALNEQGDGRHQVLTNGMYVGIAVNEQRERFGRDDFLIRRVMGVRPAEGAVAVAELVKTGQTIRMHTRDADIARSDLAMLLDAQKLHERPAGALVVSSSGRGRKLFKDGSSDAQTIERAFTRAKGGEELSKPGIPYYSGHTPPPVALSGFYSTNELAPIGGRTYAHQQTSCVALFRPLD